MATGKMENGGEGYVLRPAAIFHPLLPFYDPGCTLLGYGRRFKSWLAELGEVEEGQRILDLGCGTGVLVDLLARRFNRVAVAGVDPDPRALAIASARSGEVRSGVALLVARGEALPFANGSFDRVFSTLAFHHVPDAWRGALFLEVRRVLKRDGVFLYADFENRHRRWIPRRFRSERRLPEWLDSHGFEAERVGWRRGVHVFRATLRR